MQHIKKYFLIILLLELLLSYTPAFAQTAPYDYSKDAHVSDQIKQYLCAPTPVQSNQTDYTNGGKPVFSRTDFQNQAAFNNSNSGDLYKCINQLYKFAIVVAAVIGVFFIVIAGYVYMSAEGNTESVEKAKSILTSSLASLVILMIGYVLLKAINPDLIQFHSVQPPSVVGGTAGSLPAGGGTTNYVLSGYNIGRYATAGNHEVVVTSIYNSLSSVDLSSAQKITQYMQSKSINGRTTPLTGAMVLSSAQQRNVDLKLMLALMQTDSHFGTDGDRAIRNHNPGNVGNTDNGTDRYFNTWNDGVAAVAVWLANNRA